jgi:hypothetical protein
MGLRGHIRDERLFDAYLAKQAGDQIDPRVGEHLTDCAACTGRYEALAGFMDGLRLDVDVEVDTVFPAERLRQQRLEIARRMEQLGQTARVVSFPGRAAALPALRSSLPVAPRWIAVAAAAGLFIGVAVGTLYDNSWRPFAPQSSVASSERPLQATAPSAVPVSSRPDSHIVDDDAFLSELELAVDGPGCSELRTFDALTPAVTDARVVRIGY